MTPVRVSIPGFTALTPGQAVDFYAPPCGDSSPAAGAACAAQGSDLVVIYAGSSVAGASVAVQFDGTRLNLATMVGLAISISRPDGKPCHPFGAAVQCEDLAPTQGSPPVSFRVSSALSQLVGIPAAVALPEGGSVTFSAGTQSLPVVYESPPGQPPATGLAAQLYNAAVAYDGLLLTFELQDQRFASVKAQPPNDQSCEPMNGRGDAVRCFIGTSPSSGPIKFLVTRGPPPTGACPQVQLVAGWNLVPGALAQSINTNIGPMYTLGAESNQYEPATEAQAIPDTAGYWVLFDKPTIVSSSYLYARRQCGPISLEPAPPASVDLPPGEWVMAGNPFRAAAVSGADVVLTYDPANGYESADTLSLGQGAFAYSALGGVLIMSP